LQIRVSSPGEHLDSDDVNGIEQDLAKIDRRLSDYRDVRAEVRVNGKATSPEHSVVIELHYGRNHLFARDHSRDARQAVRAARDELLRQINDRSRGGHSSFVKGT